MIRSYASEFSPAKRILRLITNVLLRGITRRAQSADLNQTFVRLHKVKWATGSTLMWAIKRGLWQLCFGRFMSKVSFSGTTFVSLFGELFSRVFVWKKKFLVMGEIFWKVFEIGGYLLKWCEFINGIWVWKNMNSVKTSVNLEEHPDWRKLWFKYFEMKFEFWGQTLIFEEW